MPKYCIKVCNYSFVEIKLCISLFLVANKSLDELRTMYFKFKDSVFCKRGVVPQGETEVLEKILKETFGETQTLGSRIYPR